jgi:hypothetical protein
MGWHTGGTIGAPVTGGATLATAAMLSGGSRYAMLSASCSPSSRRTRSSPPRRSAASMETGEKRGGCGPQLPWPPTWTRPASHESARWSIRQWVQHGDVHTYTAGARPLGIERTGYITRAIDGGEEDTSWVCLGALQVLAALRNAVLERTTACREDEHRCCPAGTSLGRQMLPSAFWGPLRR